MDDARAALWAERCLALTGLAWIVLALGRSFLAPPVLDVAPLGPRPLFALFVVIGTVALCSVASRHRTIAPAVRYLPSLAAAILLLLGIDGQIVGFHSPRPSPWELVAIAGAACLVAIVGGRCFTREKPRVTPPRVRGART